MKKESKELGKKILEAFDSLEYICEDDKREIINGVYLELHKLIDGENIRFSCKFEKIYACISVEADDFSIEAPYEFIKAASKATNFNFYPKSNGRVCLDLMFY